MPDLADLYPGFASRWIDTAAGRIFARTGGGGAAAPAAARLSADQRDVAPCAPALARHFSLIIPDLPGYGWSDAPASDAEHAPYTKRAMARAMIEVMEALGHARFRLAGHDRGGRVAYRLALDHPGRLAQLAVLDIVPTWAMWHRMDARLANRAWHWMFLALPAPFPETLIGKAALFYFDERAAAEPRARALPRLIARARALPRLLRRSRAHPCHLRGLSRRPHHRPRPRRGVARRRREDRLPAAGDLGRRRRHPGRDRGPARDLANGRATCAAFRSTAGTISPRRRRKRRRARDRVFHRVLRTRTRGLLGCHRPRKRAIQYTRCSVRAWCLTAHWVNTGSPLARGRHPDVYRVMPSIDRQATFSGTKEVASALAIDAARLQAYLESRLPDFRGPLAVWQFKGGQSNPTYLVETPARRYVLRRKPPGRCSRRHAVDREFKVISALHAQGFPVAAPVVYCEDAAVAGTPFHPAMSRAVSSGSRTCRRLSRPSVPRSTRP